MNTVDVAAVPNVAAWVANVDAHFLDLPPRARANALRLLAAYLQRTADRLDLAEDARELGSAGQIGDT